MNINSSAYNVSVRRDNFEGEMLYEARVKELPDLAEYAETYAEVYDLAMDAIETAAAAFAEKGRPFPEPLVPADDFSGRVTLRLPRKLHGALTAAADEESVSLNQYLVNVLSYFTGYASAKHEDRASPWRLMPIEQKKAASRKRPHLRIVRCDDLQSATA